MLHIIGVDHCVQSRKLGDDGEDEDQQIFSNVLRQAFKDIHPVFVAEEESEENLHKRERISIVKEDIGFYGN